MKTVSRNKLRLHRKKSIRAKIKGTTERPRLAVFRSLKNFYVQVIDDKSGHTLVQINLSETKKKNNVEEIGKMGEHLAEKCLKQKIKEVVFDRSGYNYHGKVKSFAEGARKKGLNF